MTETKLPELTDVEREVLHHLALTEDGDPSGAGRLRWRVAHQRARHRLIELGLAHPLGGVPDSSKGYVLLTEIGRDVVDADREGFSARLLARLAHLYGAGS